MRVIQLFIAIPIHFTIGKTMLHIDDVVFNSITDFLRTPIISLGLWIIFTAYFHIRKNYGRLAANVALPLIITMAVYCMVILLLSGYSQQTLPFKYSAFIGTVYSMLIYILMVKGTSKKKKTNNLVGSVLEKSNGTASGLEVEILDLPLKVYKTNGRKILYENQSNELLHFLEENITESTLQEIMQQRYFEIKVETESVVPYILKINVSDKYRKGDCEAFLSDTLDAIADLYRRNKIKP